MNGCVKAGRQLGLQDHSQSHPTTYVLCYTMTSNRLLEVLFAALLAASGCCADHANVNAVEGDTVHLPCNRHVAAPVDWRYQRDPTDYSVYVCIDGRLLDEFKPRFAMDQSYTLTIIKVTHNDSGFYMCVEDSGLGVTHPFLLFVAEKQQQEVDLRNDMSTTSSDETNATLKIVVTTVLLIAFLEVAVVIAIYVWRRYRGRSRQKVLSTNIPMDAVQTTPEPQFSTPLLQHPEETATGCVCPAPVDEIPTDTVATGVTKMDGKMYVIKKLCSDILVYDSNTENMPGIKITDIYEPRDIVACHMTKNLYVIGLGKSGKGCIWKVSPSGKGERFIESITTSSKPNFRPHTLSIRDSRLLVTTSDDGLVWVDQTKEILGHIKRTDLKIQHAVETSRQTFVISCQKPQTIMEIGKNGLKIREYTGRCHLMEPCYLTVNSQGAILVADCKQHHILLLDNELQTSCVVVSQRCGGLVEQPWRMHYTPEENQLVICSGDEGSSVVQIYCFQYRLNEDNKVHDPVSV